MHLNGKLLQAWLQDLAWLESEYEDTLKARAATHIPEVQEKLLQEPLFCFERAVRHYSPAQGPLL